MGIVFISHRTEHFKKLYAALPRNVQRRAQAAYRLFKDDPNHPSLNFRPVITAGENAWSASIGEHYRVIGYRTGDVIIWDWIGSHEAYNRIVKQHR